MTEGELNAWHLAIGPAILLLMLLRLAWRLTHRTPPRVPPIKRGSPLPGQQRSICQDREGAQEQGLVLPTERSRPHRVWPG